MENQKRICVAICFGSSNHFTRLIIQEAISGQCHGASVASLKSKCHQNLETTL